MQEAADWDRAREEALGTVETDTEDDAGKTHDQARPTRPTMMEPVKGWNQVTTTQAGAREAWQDGPGSDRDDASNINYGGPLRLSRGPHVGTAIERIVSLRGFRMLQRSPVE